MTSPVASLSIPDSSDAVYAHDIPAERPWSRVLKQGQTLRIVDSEGQQAVDALLYCADDPAERYSAQDTLRVQGSAYIELGTRLVSNRGRLMAHISADSCGRHDTSAGCCSCESNAVRFGEATKYQHACRENFILELSKHGLTKRDIVANLNFFMNVPIDPSGAFTVVDGFSAPRKLRRCDGRHGRAVRHLQLPPGQQPLQRF
jgi:urea carboxylase-associated protein 1